MADHTLITETLLFDSFCKSLKNNEIAEAQKLFKKLNSKTKDFINITSKFIIKQQKSFTPESYNLSLRINRVTADKKEDYEDNIKPTNPKVSPKVSPRPSPKPTSPRAKAKPTSPRAKAKPKDKLKKDFDNPCQKYETPSEEDALYIFYTTLLQEKPNSKLAITWLVEYGVETDKTQIDKYKKIKKKK